MDQYDLARWQERLEADVAKAKRDAEATAKMQLAQLILVLIFVMWSLWYHTKDDDWLEKNIRHLGHELRDNSEVLQLLNNR